MGESQLPTNAAGSFYLVAKTFRNEFAKVMCMNSNIEDKAIFFYDGDCGFCSRVVLLIWKYSKNKELYFAPLQGTSAKELRRLGYKLDNDLNEVNLLLERSVHRGARAFYKTAEMSGKPLNVFSIFQYMPNIASDLMYRLISRNRKYLGWKQTCQIPSNKILEKMLP